MITTRNSLPDILTHKLEVLKNILNTPSEHKNQPFKLTLPKNNNPLYSNNIENFDKSDLEELKSDASAALLLSNPELAKYIDFDEKDTTKILDTVTQKVQRFNQIYIVDGTTIDGTKEILELNKDAVKGASIGTGVVLSTASAVALGILGVSTPPAGALFGLIVGIFAASGAVGGITKLTEPAVSAPENYLKAFYVNEALTITPQS